MSMMLGDECAGIGWDSLDEAYGFMDFGDDEI